MFQCLNPDESHRLIACIAQENTIFRKVLFYTSIHKVQYEFLKREYTVTPMPTQLLFQEFFTSYKKASGGN